MKTLRLLLLLLFGFCFFAGLLLNWSALPDQTNDAAAIPMTEQPEPPELDARPAIKPVLRQFVGYTARWCPACRQMAPVWQALEREGCEVVLVDIDRKPAWAQSFTPPAVPYTCYFEDGVPKQTWSGAVPLEEMLRQTSKP
jgi:thioredoxin-like negative regulator of GroEL